MDGTGRITAKVIATVFVLTVVAAVPAVAIQHEFSGSFTVQLVVSNFNNTAVTRNYAYDPDDLPADPGTADFLEQRVHLGYTAKLDDRLKFVSMFEIDYSYYGDSSYSVGANAGAAVGADQVNLETKNLYLDFTCPASGVNARVGMQEFTDAFEGVLLWADAAGLALSRSFGAATLSLGAFRLYDTGDVPGDQTADLFTLDGTYRFGTETTVGGAYYFISDDNGDETITAHTLGVNASAALAPATIHGYFLFQLGDLADGKNLSAFAGNAGVEAKAGPGTVRAEFQYASGDENADDKTVKGLQTFYNEYWYGSHSLALLTRDDYALTADNGVIYDVGFGGRGSMIASAGYDLPLGAKTALSCNLGAGWTVKNAGRESASLGTEANLRLTLQAYEGLTVTVRAAYLLLGSFYDGVAEGGADPDDPWDARVVLAYAF